MTSLRGHPHLTHTLHTHLTHTLHPHLTPCGPPCLTHVLHPHCPLLTLLSVWRPLPSCLTHALPPPCPLPLYCMGSYPGASMLYVCLASTLPPSGSLRRLARAGHTSYTEEPRQEWVLRQPAQLVIVVSQVGREIQGLESGGQQP